MARSRNIKPGFFVNVELGELKPLARLLFVGLWTLADREGRLKDQPRRIKVQILPYDNCDPEKLLADLNKKDFIFRYEVDGQKYIQINNFAKHQNPHYKEVPSEIPAPPGQGQDDYVCIPITERIRLQILERDGYKCKACGSKNNLTIDHIHPRSKGGTSEPHNLQTLCRSCNTSKGNRLDFNLTSSQTQDELEPNSSHVGTLIPDSLNLIPDSRNRRTDSCTVEEEVKEPKPNNKPDNNNGNKTTGNIYQAFSQNIHPITPMEHEALSEFIDEGMEEALVVWAIKQAVIHGKRSAKYITAILTNLQQEDINTLEAAEARERDREQDRLKQPGSSKARESPKLTAAEKANIETLNRQLEELTKGGSS